MPKLNSLRKTGLYKRLSREDEKAGESMSIEHQGILLRQYAEEHGFEVVDEYADDGYSGTNFDRPEVQRMLDDAKSGRIDTIIVKDLSRFGRNYIEVGQYIDYIFPAYGIRFIAINDNVDTADRTSTAMDMMPIMNVFNEWHAANTSKKIRAVLQSSQRSGKYTNWGYPYGYKAGTDDNRTALIDETAAAVVRRIFDMRAQGLSVKTITRALVDDGIPNPATYYTRLDGKKINKKFSPYWSPRTVMWILNNPIYIGTLTQHKTTSVSYKNHKIINIPENEQIVKENAHEAIISREIWEKVQTMNQSVSRGRMDKSNKVHALSGLLVCADCGKKLKFKTSKKTYKNTSESHFFTCRTYTDLGTKYCTSHTINEKVIESIVLEDIQSMLNMVTLDEAKARERFIRERARSSEQNRYSDEKQLKAYKSRLDELDKLIQTAFESRVLGNLPESVCASLCEKYQTEKVSVEEEIGKIQKRLAEASKDEEDVDEYIRRLKRYGSCEELTRETCLQLIEFITIGEKPAKGENRMIHIYYKLISKENLREFQVSRLKSSP